MRHSSRLLFLLLCSGLLIPISSPARPFALNGTAAISASYESNIFQTADNETSQWLSQLSPTLILTSTERDNAFDLTYSLDYLYNHRRSTSSTNNSLAGIWAKRLSPRTNIELTGGISLADSPASEAVSNGSLAMQLVQLDPAEQQEIIRLLFPSFNWPGGQFSPNNPLHLAIAQSEIQTRYDNATATTQAAVDELFTALGTTRKQYWNSSLGLSSTYRYATSGTINLAYLFNNNWNNTDNLSEDDSHRLSLTVAHQLSSQLQATLEASHANNHESLTDNSRITIGSLQLLYQFNQATDLSGEYRFSDTRYSADEPDQKIHLGRLTVTHRFSDHLELQASGYAERINRTTNIDEQGYGLSAGLIQRIRNGQISLNAHGSLARTHQNESWNDLRQDWDIRAALDYQPFKDLTVNLFTSYARQQFWATTTTVTRTLEAGGGLSYPLSAELLLTLSASRERQDTDNQYIDDYTNDQISLTLASDKDLFRW